MMRPDNLITRSEWERRVHTEPTRKYHAKKTEVDGILFDSKKSGPRVLPYLYGRGIGLRKNI